MTKEGKDISLIVSSLHSKVEKLVLLHRKAVEELKQVKEDNAFLRSAMVEQKEELKALNEKNKALKLAKSLSSDEKNTDLKLKINELVREIDKCIALVNN